LLEKLVVDEIPPSTRKYPAIIFKAERDCGDQLLKVEGLSKVSDEGQMLFSDISFSMDKGDKIAVISRERRAVTAFFEIITGHDTATSGTFEWGTTITRSYLPNDNSEFFKEKISLIDWLRQFSKEKEETFVRGFLGKMLFSGEESLKMCTVLSGGEKVRCMISRMMLTNANCLILDEPTNHLDLESITAFNEAMKDWRHIALFSSHDHAFTDSVANRIIELTPGGIIDKRMRYDEFLEDPRVQETRAQYYGTAVNA
jgi:ATPase subunit of ABC transporter with duplicated ATPase domains